MEDEIYRMNEHARKELTSVESSAGLWQFNQTFAQDKIHE